MTDYDHYDYYVNFAESVPASQETHAPDSSQVNRQLIDRLIASSIVRDNFNYELKRK